MPVIKAEIAAHNDLPSGLSYDIPEDIKYPPIFANPNPKVL